MCDTMVVLGNSTREGKVLFAKNSDRQPNEPHILVHIPRTRHPYGQKVRTTYIELEQAELTYEVFLLKPSWIWGCEMGANEFGLNIGNEAVFTREKYETPGLIGMDMIRLALERCKNSEQALGYMIDLLGEYGQGGNCGYEKEFTYHNSFLIADSKTAWVLETAGKYWVAEQVREVRSISNCLSIGKRFDRAHPHVIDHAVKKGRCKSGRDFDFARCYSDPVYTYFSAAKTRQQISRSILQSQKGNIDEKLLLDILRTHHSDIEGRQLRKASLKSICMHAGGVIGDHTTGSYIAVISDELSSYMVTGSSTPCLSIFKPVWLLDDSTIPFTEDQYDSAMAYWIKRERFHRMVIYNRISNLPEYMDERERMEREWLKAVNRLEKEKAGKTQLKLFMENAWKKESELIKRMIIENEKNAGYIKGNPFYKNYWRRQTEKLQ